MNKPLELSDWIEHVKDKCLTISDVKDFKEGDTHIFLVMDRNLYDIVENDFNPENIPKNPVEFFKYNLVTYKHYTDLKGLLTFHFEGLFPSDEKNNLTRPFEFEIEYEQDCWYPCRDGFLPTIDFQGIAKFEWLTPKSYTTFPPNTRVGWRGPMIKYELLNNLPHVFWKE